MLMKKTEYEVANSEFWYILEEIYDFVLCFEIDTGNIIRKTGFDRVCISLDSYKNYYELMKEYKRTYVSEISMDEFTQKTSIEYILLHRCIEFTGLEIIESKEMRWYSYKIVPKGNVATLLIRDIHDAKSREERLKEMSTIDKMTGSLNRSSFDEFVEEKIQKDSPPFAIAFIDIDDFKKINDEMGHLMGDEVLKEFGTILQNLFAEHSVIGRYGGDEFIVCVENIESKYRLLESMDQLQLAIIDPLKCGVKLSISVGIALYPNNGETRKELYESADKALYEMKEKGKNGYMLAIGKARL